MKTAKKNKERRGERMGIRLVQQCKDRSRSRGLHDCKDQRYPSKVKSADYIGGTVGGKGFMSGERRKFTFRYVRYS